jgi:hypothetical protein
VGQNELQTGLSPRGKVTADQRRDLLEIVDDPYGKGSLLITSQVLVSQWHDVIADPTLGDAILDRIIHNAHRIELKGDSLRRQAGEKNREHLAHGRPAGPQASPAHVAPSLVGALRAAHGALPWTAGTIFEPTRQLDEEAISSTHKLVSRVGPQT